MCVLVASFVQYYMEVCVNGTSFRFNSLFSSERASVTSVHRVPPKNCAKLVLSEARQNVYQNLLIIIHEVTHQQNCKLHLRRLRQLRGVVTDEVMKQLLLLSRLDYCNSVLFGLPASTLALLQRVQNVAARLVLRLDHRAHIKPALQRLHWLPVKPRIQFKIATMMHALNQRGPALLRQCHKIHQRRIWTSPSPFLYNQCSCCHEEMHTVREARAFSICGPSIWNHAPPHIRNHSAPAFRKALKDLFVFANHLDTVLHYRSHWFR